MYIHVWPDSVNRNGCFCSSFGAGLVFKLDSGLENKRSQIFHQVTSARTPVRVHNTAHCPSYSMQFPMINFFQRHSSTVLEAIACEKLFVA
jgi:hypothetical protein